MVSPLPHWRHWIPQSSTITAVLTSTYTRIQSLESLTNLMAVDMVTTIPYLDHCTEFLTGLPDPLFSSPQSLFFTHLLELIS